MTDKTSRVIMDENSTINEFSFYDLQSYQYAGFFIRFVAYVIDMALVSSIYTIIFGSIFHFMAFEPSDSVSKLLRLIVTVLYFALTTLFLDGQTIGKAIVGIKLVRLSGKKLDTLTVAIREVCGRIIYSIFPLNLLYIVAGFTKRKQHLVDFLTDTTVIYENRL